ncbi:MAG: CPBP family intramembrane metalloprotease [Prevotella sp.]|jgi:membrane protease YdiL (CAAX protease family)|nr:CPBP family intramembrane metalloprotease [Prevotella sp.]
MKYLEVAFGRNDKIWIYLLVLILAWIGGSILGSIPLIAVLFLYSGPSILMQGFDITTMNELGISSNLSLILILLPFVVGLFALILLIKVIHRRSYKEVINGTNKIRWNRFWAGVIGWGILLFLTTAIDYILDPENYTLQFDIKAFIPLVIISLVIIPLQTSFEELSFRGYLAQGIGRLTKSRWLVLIIPSVLFGLMHYSNPEVKEYGFWLMMPNYILIGLLLGLVSILDDGIEMALGIHAINNIFSSLFTTYSSSVFQTASVFRIEDISPVRSLIGSVIVCLIFVYFFYKKYNWKFSTLNRRIVKNEEDIIKAE